MGKTTMHTVLENGNFDEVGFASVNLPQNANVGIGSLLCVCQCAFWSVLRRNCQTLFSAFPFVSDVFVLSCLSKKVH